VRGRNGISGGLSPPPFPSPLKGEGFPCPSVFSRAVFHIFFDIFIELGVDPCARTNQLFFYPSQLHDDRVERIRTGCMGEVFICFPGKLSAKAQNSPVGVGGIKGRGAESLSIFADPQSKFIAQIEFLPFPVSGIAGSLDRNRASQKSLFQDKKFGTNDLTKRALSGCPERFADRATSSTVI